MDNLENEPKPTQPLDKTPAPETAKSVPEVVKPKVKTETRGERFLRMSIRWIAGFLIVFGLGALAVIYLLYLPQRTALLSAKAELEASQATAQAKAVDLQTEVTRLESTASQSQNIQSSVEQRDQHILILKALTNVQAARANLALNDEVSAQAALASTEQSLLNLEPLVSAEQKSVITSMQNRLTLIKEEIGKDAFAAQSDLSVLAASLEQLEETNFGKP